jgi:mono/diheme cytochrome c family protein
MPRALRITALACLAFLNPRDGFAQALSGDVAAGRRLAEATCRTCHQIDRNQPPTAVGAPDWPSIATMPSTTALSLTVFLQSSHRNMPNLILAPAEIEDLVAYILNLKSNSAN